MGFDPTAIAKMFSDAQAGPAASAKEQLDAYRALNNGALPPGMTPEQAMMIDMGISSEMLLANPGLMAQLQQLAASRATQQTDFAAARQQVGDNYQQLTGDVEQQGQNFLTDIMARMGVTPQQGTYDPTITGYGETITNMGETADQNQATDQAWFDKMAQVYDQQLAGIQTSLLAPPVLEGGGSGGGGGFGGGGRGGRGGSGSGDGGWKDPKTTDALVQSADVKAVENYPGFMAEIAGMFTDPEELEFAKRVADAAGNFPHNVAKRVAGVELPTAEALNETLLAQQAASMLYNDTLPIRTSQTADRFNELTEEELALLSLAEQESYGTDQRINELVNSPAQPVGNGREISSFSRRFLPNIDWFSGEDSKTWGSRTGDPYVASQLQMEKDKAEWEAARDAASTDNPFSYSEWEGYVPEVSEEDLTENEWQMSILRRILDKARENHPSYDMQITQQSMQDSSDTKTTQTSQSPFNDLFNNNDPVIEEEVPAIANGAMPGFGASRGFGNLTESAQRIIANRLRKVEEAAQTQAPVVDTGPLNGVHRASRPSAVAPTGMKPVKPVPTADPFSIDWGAKPVKKLTPPSKKKTPDKKKEKAAKNIASAAARLIKF